MKSLIQSLIFLVCLHFAGVVVAADPDQKASPKADVRVIIDVSGSMKKNDPDNLRVPALKLLVGLLPEGVQAGVWNFGTKVKPLVKLGVVDKDWKSRANKSANKIYSGDLFTDVESALKRVTRDWSETDSETKRNIILLTDGMVDVSKKSEESTASRQRIIDQLIPELQKKGVTVHTISLSENADLEIMDALALGTDGSSELVTSADQLQRVFLHMFEKSAPRDTVPLEDNQFTIDKMIEEFTLLVFRNNDIKETTVIKPGGDKFTHKTAPKNVAWLKEDGYDLITITKPTAGIWKVDAAIDPDNRVMVVSKLKLHTSDLPNSIFLGEEYDYKFWLTANGKIIEKDAFYDLTEMEIVQSSGGEIQEVWDIKSRNVDNEFVQRLGQSFTAGQFDISVIVDGKTFKRQHKKTIKVYEKFYDVDIKVLAEVSGDKAHIINVIPEDDLVERKTFNVIANITAPDGTESQVHGKMSMRGDKWIVTIKEPMPGEYNVVLKVSALTKSGREISVSSAPLKVGESLSVADDEDDPDEVKEETEETDWMKVGLLLLAANAVLFGLLGGGWFFLKKRRKNTPEPGEDL